MRFLISIAMLVIALPASAHTINVTYLDVQQMPEGIVLTTAFQPHQALVIAGLRHDDHDMDEGGFADLIPALKQRGDVIAAYAATHITITANDDVCDWDPTRFTVPDTELNALADGVTVSGTVTCTTGPVSELQVSTSLLFDAFPTSQTIVRLEYPDGFADKLTLTAKSPQGRLALETKPSVERSDAVEAQSDSSRIATILGWAVLLLVVCGAGFAVYRMNIASPKE